MPTYCQYCGEELPEHTRRVYCSTRCRRDAQNERRRDERAELREAREAEQAMPMGNPFDPDFIARLDWWEAAEIYSNACLDPEPAKHETSLDLLNRLYEEGRDRDMKKPGQLIHCWLTY